jgi:predicted ATPase
VNTLPSGTVTFLFTDIEGSTRLLNELGAQAYADALVEHRRVIREACEQFGGIEVDTVGDAFFVAFAAAQEALAAARQATRALAAGPIRVRMGLHTGTPLSTVEGYVGVDLHRAARIAAAGHGGQVLVSQATASLVDREELRDLGEHRFKDLAAPERVFQLGQDDFPRLKSLYQTNLPSPPTPFVGRESELAEVTALLVRDDVRLLTLTGPGGSGKTRLALQAAAQVSDGFPDGVFWVGLGPLRDPALVTDSIAQVLGAKEDLAGYIDSKRLQLVLDNFEHLIAASTELGRLLAACPELTLLVTSREPLQLSAEREYRVLPLGEADATLFFRERAQAAGVAVAEDVNVVEICRRLDNLPLALELAAARAKVLSPQALLGRLEQRLPLLTGGPRDAPERQRTLRSTIAWSYELLEEDEQRLFARLAVFAGGCTVQAAEQTCEADLDTLQSLIDKSLLRRTEERFWMLETIREYALERLEERGERGTTEQRHRDYYAALAMNLEEAFFGAAGTDAHHQLETEHDNLRAVLRRALDGGDGELALRLATALAPHWRSSNNREGLRWLEEALEMTDAAATSLHARAHLRAGVLASRCGDESRAFSHGERALEVAGELGDSTVAAAASVNLALVSVHQRHYEDAATRFEHAAGFFAEVGDDYRCSMAVNNLAIMMLLQGEHDRAGELVARALSLLPEGEEEETASILHTDGVVRLAVGDEEGARTAFARLVDIALRLGDTILIASGVEGLASLAAAVGDWERAAVLFGFVGAYCVENEVFDPVTRELAEPYLRNAQGRAGSEELGRARRRGEAMSAKDAVAYAMVVTPRSAG